MTGQRRSGRSPRWGTESSIGGGQIRGVPIAFSERRGASE
ncbi:MAG: hypothetical protein QOJ09_1343 [Actinomycetota bacterium]|nr:hypothetical protein [Actinomycetota bacterium]